ncbi:M20 peptidase aminoacylase family protein [Domibacillus aminovorans]|uniref:Amidohydrolase n=1 Tax=Domibacillus aminovorans TaxID=29332 RepID=A0A177L147_9BACI|nr:M20 peptidase aminoacylase family protein [Domibacillus aminovorans]OAH59047.1 amidohydrolase [Domibacillus aminovorans]
MAQTDIIFENRLLEIFEHLHAHPEISWKETKTTAYISRLLQSEGVRSYTFDDCTGLIAEIGTGSPVVAVRADIDALWQQVNGEFRANHSCGHDAHMSIVIGSLLKLKEEITQGTVRFIFQPAEETGTGALKMVSKGVVDDVDYLFGMHLRPIEEVPFGKIAPSVYHGAVAFLNGKVIGDDAHGARPYQGVNAIEVMSSLSRQLHTINFSPFEPYSAKMTRLEAGGQSLNIIPGSGKFGLDVRAQRNKILLELQKAIEHKIEQISLLYEVKIDYEWMDFTPAAEVSKDAEAFLRKGIIKVAGSEALAEPLITPGSDDFHFYTIKRPHIKAAMMGLGSDLVPGLHHPNMTFDRRVIKIGADVLAASVKYALEDDNSS